MQNQILHVHSDFDINSLKSESYHFAILDGNNISDKADLLLSLEEIFKMPDANNWDAVADWLSDLEWLGKEGYILYIMNYASLLASDMESKEIFLEILSDTAKWWAGDVEKNVVGGKKKSFNVYLAD